MKNIARLFFIGFLLFNFWGRGFIVGGSLNTVYAQEQGDWKQEYAEICAKTQNAMEMSVAELKDRIVERYHAYFVRYRCGTITLDDIGKSIGLKKIITFLSPL